MGKCMLYRHTLWARARAAAGQGASGSPGIGLKGGWHRAKLESGGPASEQKPVSHSFFLQCIYSFVYSANGF